MKKLIVIITFILLFSSISCFAGTPIQFLIQSRERDYPENLTEERQAALNALGIQFTDNISFNTKVFETKKLITAISLTITNPQELQDLIDGVTIPELGFRWIILAATQGWIININGDLVPNHLIYYKKGIVAIYLIDTTEPYQIGTFQGVPIVEGED